MFSNKQLREKYPQFMTRDRFQIPGLPPSGWAKIMDEFFHGVIAIGAEHCYATGQAKEKFGTLRLYTYGCPEHEEAIRELARKAEAQSDTACQVCGDIGERVTVNYWVHTLCQKHHEVRKNGRPEWPACPWGFPITECDGRYLSGKSCPHCEG